MDEEVKPVGNEDDGIITKELDSGREKNPDEGKFLKAKENVEMEEDEEDVTDKDGHLLGGVTHLDVGTSNKKVPLPEVVEEVKQAMPSNGDPEKPGISKITLKDTEITCTATKVTENGVTEPPEEISLRQNLLQSEINRSMSKATIVGIEQEMVERNEVLQCLEGALTKIENSDETIVPLKRDGRTVEEDVEMDCSGGEVTNQTVSISEVGNTGTQIGRSSEDKSQTNASTKSDDEEMTELKADITGGVTIETSVENVEIEITAESSVGGLSNLSKALSEVETGTDQDMVEGRGSLVAYSSSGDEDSVDSSASSSSTCSSSDSDSDSEDNSSSRRIVDKEAGDKKEEQKTDEGDADDQESDNDEGEETRTGAPAPIKTKKEVMLEDLPEVPYVEFRLADGEEINLLGKVSSIIGQLVVVASNRGTPALNEETVLFKENRHPIGVVFEIFGPVSNPFYTVRFNSTKDISDLELNLNADIFFAPRREEITKYVFVKQLQVLKGSDASWINDDEPPVECLDYSDDEEEKAAKKKKVLEDGKRKPARRRDESSSQDNSSTTGQHTSFNARNNHHQYSARGGPSRGPYHNNFQRPRTPVNNRTSPAQGPRPQYSYNTHRQQHGGNNWSQQQSHMFPPRVPFDGQNIHPFESNFHHNSNFSQRVPPLPFQNQSLPCGDAPAFWLPQQPQHFMGTPHPPPPPTMSPYSVPPPPLMSIATSPSVGMVPPPRPPGPPP